MVNFIQALELIFCWCSHPVHYITPTPCEIQQMMGVELMRLEQLRYLATSLLAGFKLSKYFQLCLQAKPLIKNYY